MHERTPGKKITLLSFSDVPVRVLKAAVLAEKIIVICLLLLTCGVLTACGDADPFSDSRPVSTTLFVPEIEAMEQYPTRAGYEGYGNISRLDIFIFNDDALRKLDSYSCISRPETAYITVSSSVGDKLVVMFANCEGKTFTSADYWNYDALEEVRWKLADEDPQRPVMSGECQVTAGTDGYTPLQLTPLMAEVCLDFLSCDFSGRGYRSRTLENACVYLTNVSASTEIMRQNGFRVSQLENQGSLDREYLEGMEHPEILYRSVLPSYWKPISLYCYPNDGEEVLGNPHTRMVIQGDIDGTTYYYPIEINQEGFGYSAGVHGLSRNIKYSYGVKITRKGSLDPDTPIGPENVVERGWIELHPGNVITGVTGQKVHIWCDVFPEATEINIARDDLDYDVERGIYTYEMDSDGHGVTLTLKDGGSGMFTIDAGPPVNDGFLIVVIVNP